MGRVRERLARRQPAREKARRAAARFDLSAFDRIHAYRDTAEDEPLLAMATDRFYRTMPETAA